MLSIQHTTIRFLRFVFNVCLIMGLSGCHKSNPQQVRHLGKETPIDSTLLAKMEFNQKMATAADRECLTWIKNAPVSYTLDDFGFWYRKDVKMDGEPITSGQNVLLRVLIRELNGNLLADTEDYFVLGSDNMPTAMNRALKNMRIGETITIVTPWYLAYGVEGKGIIKPYTNLIITIATKE